MWWWHKVRKANIPAALRERFELIGVQVLSGALVISLDTPDSPLFEIRHRHRAEAEAWLREQRDEEERRHDRLETVEWAILVAVVFGVLVDLKLLYH